MTCAMCGRPSDGRERCEWCEWEGEEAARLLADGWTMVAVVDLLNRVWAWEVGRGA